MFAFACFSTSGWKLCVWFVLLGWTWWNSHLTSVTQNASAHVQNTMKTLCGYAIINLPFGTVKAAVGDLSPIKNFKTNFIFLPHCQIKPQRSVSEATVQQSFRHKQEYLGVRLGICPFFILEKLPTHSYLSIPPTCLRLFQWLCEITPQGANFTWFYL